MYEDIIKSGIIEPQQLNELLSGEHTDTIKILDATFVLPTSSENPHGNFVRERIGNAQFFDVDKICDPHSTLPHMLCTADSFAQRISRLGISNDDLVVVYAQTGMIMGPARAWWMFRVFGHDKVCVLNGGLPAWRAEGLPLNTQPPAPPASSNGGFTASKNENLVINKQAMLDSLNNASCTIFDARPAERFEGKASEPRPGMRSGHIPGSANIPCSLLVDGKTGKLKPTEEIKAAFAQKGFSPDKDVHLTCGSGITACFLALALYHTGHTKTRVYDGSWSEWGLQDAGTPIANAASA